MSELKVEIKIKPTIWYYIGNIAYSLWLHRLYKYIISNKPIVNVFLGNKKITELKVSDYAKRIR